MLVKTIDGKMFDSKRLLSVDHAGHAFEAVVAKFLPLQFDFSFPFLCSETR